VSCGDGRFSQVAKLEAVNSGDYRAGNPLNNPASPLYFGDSGKTGPVLSSNPPHLTVVLRLTQVANNKSLKEKKKKKKKEKQGRYMCFGCCPGNNSPPRRNLSEELAFNGPHRFETADLGAKESGDKGAFARGISF
jgi:hypothetical protein